MKMVDRQSHSSGIAMVKTIAALNHFTLDSPYFS